MNSLAGGDSGEVLVTNPTTGFVQWQAPAAAKVWHGSATLLKVMPTEFIMNNDYTRHPVVVNDDTANLLGIVAPGSTSELYAFVAIPSNMKATHVQVYASASTSLAVDVQFYNHTTGYAISKSTGDFNTNIDIVDLDSSSTNNLVIKLLPSSYTTKIYGADVTLSNI